MGHHHGELLDNQRVTIEHHHVYGKIHYFYGHFQVRKLVIEANGMEIPMAIDMYIIG